MFRFDGLLKFLVLFLIFVVFCWFIFFFYYYVGLFSCVGKLDGMYLNLFDCFKYYVCEGGVMYERYCLFDLFYNVKIKLCDWLVNVEC